MIQKRHDKDLCRYNCEKNGKAFHHEPFSCKYFTNHVAYNDLLTKRTISTSDYPDGLQIETDENAEKLLELADMSSIWEQSKIEVQLGCSKYEDIIDTEASVANRYDKII